MVKTAMRTMNAVKDGRDRLMDAIFGVREAGACVAPDYWCGCYLFYGYVCGYYNCIGEFVWHQSTPPGGIGYCPGL